ncbi:MAG: type I methionyl aminopeptidase [Patescibacteria group bacterium]
MITIKSQEEIKILREGGLRLAQILTELASRARPGVSSAELDKLGRELAEKNGDRPAFLGYKPKGVKTPYPASVCVSINDEVVHGIPSGEKILEEGDIVAIDMGLIHKNLITDSAVTVIVGGGRGEGGDKDGKNNGNSKDKNGKKAQTLVDVTKKALQKGIEAALPGNTVGDIGYAIEQFVGPFGYGHAEGLAGHGVGYKVHEDPFVPNTGKKGDGPALRPGMVIAIEPMLTEGAGKVVFDKDGYTVRTKDGKRSAHFEHTVAITENGNQVLTKTVN